MGRHPRRDFQLFARSSAGRVRNRDRAAQWPCHPFSPDARSGLQQPEFLVPDCLRVCRPGSGGDSGRRDLRYGPGDPARGLDQRDCMLRFLHGRHRRDAGAHGARKNQHADRIGAGGPSGRHTFWRKLAFTLLRTAYHHQRGGTAYGVRRGKYAAALRTGTGSLPSRGFRETSPALAHALRFHPGARHFVQRSPAFDATRRDAAQRLSDSSGPHGGRDVSAVRIYFRQRFQIRAALGGRSRRSDHDTRHHSLGSAASGRGFGLDLRTQSCRAERRCWLWPRVRFSPGAGHWAEWSTPRQSDIFIRWATRC